MTVHARDWFYGEKIGEVAKELYEAGYAFDYISPRMVKAGLAKKYVAVVDPKSFNTEARRHGGTERLEGVRKMPFDAKSGLLATRWKKDGETAYFVVNTGAVAKVVASKGTFTAADPLTGEIMAVREVALSPLHSRFLVGDGFEVKDCVAGGTNAFNLPGPWHVEPVCGGPALPAPRKCRRADTCLKVSALCIAVRCVILMIAAVPAAGAPFPT
jgi:hypothetical protein